MAREVQPDEVVLDSSVLIGAEHESSAFTALKAALLASGIAPVVPIPVLAEVWRDGGRQARLARALEFIEPGECTQAIAKRAGSLLAATGGNNAIDAIVVATAEARVCGVITADVADLRPLANLAHGVTIEAF